VFFNVHTQCRKIVLYRDDYQHQQEEAGGGIAFAPQSPVYSAKMAAGSTRKSFVRYTLYAYSKLGKLTFRGSGIAFATQTQWKSSSIQVNYLPWSAAKRQQPADI
jgi:hypothetical protein